MSYVNTVTFHGGPKHGVTSRQPEPMPNTLVFQGIIEGRFQVCNYRRVPDTNHYRYVATTQATQLHTSPDTPEETPALPPGAALASPQQQPDRPKHHDPT